MYKMKNIDGTPVDEQYLAQTQQMISDAANAVEMFGEDELEAYADRLRQREEEARRASATVN